MSLQPYQFRGGALSDYRIGTGAKGTCYTEHIPTGFKIQSVVQEGRVPLSIPGLPLITNLLSLGVGVYTAYQVHAVQSSLQSVDEAVRAVGSEVRTWGQLIVGRFSLIEDALKQQADVLALVAESGLASLARLQRLEGLLVNGFQDVLEVIDSLERKEFLERCWALQNAYRDFARALQSESERSNLRSRADDLRSWIQARTSDLDPLRSAPYWAAHVLARRARADVFQHSDQQLAREELLETAQELSAWTWNLTKGRSLIDVGTELHFPIVQMAFLRRGVLKGAEALDAPEEGLTFRTEELAFDDGLSPLREVIVRERQLASAPASRASLPLETIGDYRWYCEWQEHDVEKFNVHSRKEVPATELLASLGHRTPDSVPVQLQELAALKELVLPSTRTRIAESFAAEFGWAELPEFSRPANSAAAAQVSGASAGDGGVARQLHLSSAPAAPSERSGPWLPAAPPPATDRPWGWSSYMNGIRVRGFKLEIDGVWTQLLIEESAPFRGAFIRKGNAVRGYFFKCPHEGSIWLATELWDPHSIGWRPPRVAIRLDALLRDEADIRLAETGTRLDARLALTSQA